MGCQVDTRGGVLVAGGTGNQYIGCGVDTEVLVVTSILIVGGTSSGCWFGYYRWC